MPFRFGWAFVLICMLSMEQQESAPSCCGSESEKLSSHQMKALLQKTEPIYLPGAADKLHIKGAVVMAVGVDDKGKVDCVRIIAGHPLIVGTTIDSVKLWKFRPYVVGGIRKTFCGKVAISYKASGQGVRYRVIEAPQVQP